MEERRKKEKDKTKEKQICYNCKKEGHIKRNCPEIKCFYCNGNHLKKHCIKYYLNQRYKKWINKKEKDKKSKGSQKETKELQETKEITKNGDTKEIQKKLKKDSTSTLELGKNAVETKQDPKEEKQLPIIIKTGRKSQIKETKSKTTQEEKRKKWLLTNPSNSKKNIPWNKEYKEKEKKKIELQAKIQAESQDKEIEELEKKIEQIEAIHKDRKEYIENMKNKYKNIKNFTQFEEASYLIDLLFYEKTINTFMKAILQINQRFETAEQKKKAHKNIYWDIQDLQKLITEGEGRNGGTLSKETINAIPEEARAKWTERLQKLKEW